MKSTRISGQISVFLCIVTMSVFVLAGVLVEAARFHSAKSLAEMAVENAAGSVLCGYGSKLEDKYGVMAFFAPKAEEAEITAEVQKYLEKNLMPASGESTSGVDRIKLYDFRIEELTVTPVCSLTDNGVFKKQVLEYMKYRAPKELLQGFMDKLGAFREIGRMAEAYKKKIAIDKILAVLDKAQQGLKRNISGNAGEEEKQKNGLFINGFNLEGEWMEKLNEYVAICSRITSARKSMEELAEVISSLSAETVAATDSGNGEEEERTEGVDEKAQQLLQYQMTMISLQGELLAAQGEAEEVWKTLRYTMTEEYLTPNLEAGQEIAEILETGKTARKSFEELLKFIEENFKGSDNFTGEFISGVREELDKFDDFINCGEKALLLMGDIEENISTLKAMAEGLDSLKPGIDSGTLNSENVGAGLTEASGKLASLVQDYKELSYEYEKPEKVSGAKDPRGISIGAAETLLQLVSEEDVNYLNEGIAADELPSGADSPDETEKLDADLYDGESSFQGNALGLAGTIGGFSEADPADLRDNLYLNEYIMGTFKNAVPGDKGFDGHEKSEKDTFYNYEAEYILHGNASQNINKNLVTAELLALRFALDTLHVYTDSRKRELAAGIAAATAGWWTGGAGIPVVSNLIMCGWGLGEAVIDTSDLLKGERVPLFKSKGDWKLDIGIASEGEKKSGDLFAMGYYDYLRVFLLITPEEKKLERMQDLIQLNLGTEQENASVACFNTCIRVEAIISVNSLFLNSGFIPEDIRGYGLNAAGGRKKIRIVYLKGY